MWIACWFTRRLRITCRRVCFFRIWPIVCVVKVACADCMPFHIPIPMVVMAFATDFAGMLTFMVVLY